MRSFDPQEMGKWLKPGLRVKRWLILLALGMGLLGLGFAQAYVALFRQGDPPLLHLLPLGFLPATWRVLVAGTVGGCALAVALYELNTSIVQPIVSGSSMSVEALLRRQRLEKGLKVVAVGGGTGLPSVLRGMKHYTSHITAVVTMADDGGSSGRLRREMNVPPPGDLRNNIAALSDDEDLMTRLFQYRFGEGGLEGHSFGNLFLTALSDITGNMEAAEPRRPARRRGVRCRHGPAHGAGYRGGPARQPRSSSVCVQHRPATGRNGWLWCGRASGGTRTACWGGRDRRGTSEQSLS